MPVPAVLTDQAAAAAAPSRRRSRRGLRPSTRGLAQPGTRPAGDPLQRVRSGADPGYPRPARRPLRIFAFDPMLGRVPDNKITLDVANEPLRPGPAGAQIAVVDYDGTCDCFYPPIDLDHPSVLLQDGLEPTESDPRFHQQMIFAVATKVVENFERALGRRLAFRDGRPLRLFPHAFRGRNAFYHRALSAILFGYFAAEPVNVGGDLPGQTVFTCLSHDIVAHETTHAVVDQLRAYFFEPTNRDVYAFHEGFADVVAIFQHFTFPDILRRYVQQTRGDLHDRTPLVSLAQEFGYATGAGRALRDALDPQGKPDPTLYQHLTEPHERGAVLVAAVFDAFFQVYQKRIADLLRIATGGTGRLPEGDLHPDLVNRIAEEAARCAQSILTMCIRALEYLPPVDVTFGDYLRALVTADTDLVSVDRLGQRLAMIEGFRERGVYPQHVVSLAEDSLVWEDRRGTMPPLPLGGAGNIVALWGRGGARWSELRASNRPLSTRRSPTRQRRDDRLARTLRTYAAANARALSLDPEREIEVHAFHPVFRVSPDGQLLIELVAQFVQTDQQLGGEARAAYGGVPVRGGTTVIASGDGAVRYVIAKPLPAGARDAEQRDQAESRLRAQRQFVADLDLADPQLPWADAEYLANRMALRLDLAAVHRRIPRTVPPDVVTTGGAPTP